MGFGSGFIGGAGGCDDGDIGLTVHRGDIWRLEPRIDRRKDHDGNAGSHCGETVAQPDEAALYFLRMGRRLDVFSRKLAEQFHKLQFFQSNPSFRS